MASRPADSFLRALSVMSATGDQYLIHSGLVYTPLLR